MGRLKILLIILFSIPSALYGQISKSDSVDIKNQIESFYSWYIDMIKDGNLNKDFNPSFARKNDGMTTLDFKNYTDGLRKHKFSENHINRKIKDYKDCVNNLKKIPFDTFSNYTDLDDFESIKCDFSNRYEWIGGMESVDKSQLIALESQDKNTITGNLIFISGEFVSGKALVTFKKIKKNWTVDKILLQ